PKRLQPVEFQVIRNLRQIFSIWLFPPGTHTIRSNDQSADLSARVLLAFDNALFFPQTKLKQTNVRFE
ncbi:hypothetical protein, partial [Sutterella wadsworthensis]|uniref:hypothetical protein n=1 Tax=Sutterella wadsworthensis TaxID=40545 RepID=UPI003FEE2AC0